MPWYESTVPGRGWIDLRVALSRVRTPGVRLMVELPPEAEAVRRKTYNPHDERNLERQEKGQALLVSAVYGPRAGRSGPQRVRAAAERAFTGRQGWLRWWEDILDQDEDTFTRILRWSVWPWRPKR